MKLAAAILVLTPTAPPPPIVHVYEFTAPVALDWTAHVAVPRTTVPLAHATITLTATSEIALVAESVAPHSTPPRSAVVASHTSAVTMEGATVRSTAQVVGRVRTMHDGATDFRGESGTRELGRRARTVALDLPADRFRGRGKEALTLAGTQHAATTAKGNPNTLRGWIARTRVRVEVTLWP